MQPAISLWLHGQPNREPRPPHILGPTESRACIRPWTGRRPGFQMILCFREGMQRRLDGYGTGQGRGLPRQVMLRRAAPLEEDRGARACTDAGKPREGGHREPCRPGPRGHAGSAGASMCPPPRGPPPLTDSFIWPPTVLSTAMTGRPAVLPAPFVGGDPGSRKVSRDGHALDRLSLYAGVLSIALGVYATASVLFSIWVAQGDCQGGLGPVPPQGCGYVPQLALFFWGEYGTLSTGIFLVYAGLAVLVARWVVTRRRGRPRQPSEGRDGPPSRSATGDGAVREPRAGEGRPSSSGRPSAAWMQRRRPARTASPAERGTSPWRSNRSASTTAVCRGGSSGPGRPRRAPGRWRARRDAGARAIGGEGKVVGVGVIYIDCVYGQGHGEHKDRRVYLSIRGPPRRSMTCGAPKIHC